MAEFGGALDRWLEAPYVNAAKDEADYEAWCEAKGLDPADDHWTEFEDARSDAEAEYERKYAQYHGNEDTAEGYGFDYE